KMTDGVLQYASMSALEQSFQQTDLNEIIKDIESDLEILITEKHATIKTAPLPSIEGSSILLYQLFYNLINNSLKFSRADVRPVITINAETEKRKFSQNT